MSTTTVKERPILFNGDMVRAILDGRKTQTRRVINLEKAYHDCPAQIIEWREQNGRWFGLNGWNTVASCLCPFGSTGDRLWVRETWLPFDNDHVISDVRFAYRATTSKEGDEYRLSYVKAGRNYRWRPSIHMPRQASRITLEITGVRVERLNDISRCDAKSEGIKQIGFSERAIDTPGGEEMVDLRCWRNYMNPETPFGSMSQIHSFASLWESINGKGSWALNPWVWVVEFRNVADEQSATWKGQS